MGNKKKLIARGLTDLFPKDIDTFIDLFAGSAIASMNTKAKSYVINDKDIHLYNFYKMFSEFTAEEIIGKIKTNIEYFKMNQTGVKQNTPEAEIYKPRYIHMRSKANESKDITDLYSCMFYAFSQQMRFNKNGDFNMPFGNRTFTTKNEEYIFNGCKFFSLKELKICNKDFREIDLSSLSSDDFVYIDPPYIGTTATYTENGGWSEADEYDLHKLCEQLTAMNVKFALSNVFKNKGVVNQQLIDWVENNEYYVHYFDGFNYMACGKGNAKTIEVLITNYKTGEKINE